MKGAFVMQRKKVYNQIVNMLRKLAFGRSKNVLKLLFDGECDFNKKVKGLDFSAISGIKVGKNCLEIKFVDCLKALEKLYELTGSSDITENDLYDMIAQSVEKCNEGQ